MEMREFISLYSGEVSTTYSEADPDPEPLFVSAAEILRYEYVSEPETDDDDAYQPNDATYQTQAERDEEMDDEELVDIELSVTVNVPPGMPVPDFEFFTKHLVTPSPDTILEILSDEEDDEDMALPPVLQHRNPPASPPASPMNATSPSTLVVDRVFNDSVYNEFPKQFFDHAIDYARYFSDDHNVDSRHLIHLDINHKFITNWARGGDFLYNSGIYNEIRRLGLRGQHDVDVTTLESHSIFNTKFKNLVRLVARLKSESLDNSQLCRLFNSDCSALDDVTHTITVKSICDFDHPSAVRTLITSVSFTNIYRYTFDVTNVPSDILEDARFLVFDSEYESFYRNVSRPFVRNNSTYVSLDLLDINESNLSMYFKLYLIHVRNVDAARRDMRDIELVEVQ